jgi:membrane protease YdiL (CAAX protease family)
MIKFDSISLTLYILNIFMILFLSVYQLSLVLLFSLILALSGGFLMLIVQRVPQEADYYQSEEKGLFSKNFLFSLVGLVAIFIIAFTTNIFTIKFTQSVLQQVQSFPPQFQKLFTASMAISEEVFFRGFLLNWLSNINFIFANFSQALIFAVYHFAVYGNLPQVLIYVFFSGIILGLIAWKTQSLTTCMLTHIAVNVLS